MYFIIFNLLFAVYSVLLSSICGHSLTTSCDSLPEAVPITEALLGSHKDLENWDAVEYLQWDCSAVERNKTKPTTTKQQRSKMVNSGEETTSRSKFLDTVQQI